MNGKGAFQIIGMIDDDLIVEASGAVKKVRRMRLKKIVALAAALALLAGITAWAAGVILRGRSSSVRSIPDYYSVPSAEALMQDIGIAPNIPASFANGFAFSGGHIVENEDYDGDGSVLESYRSISCDYKKDSELVSLHVDASIAGNQMDHCETAKTYKNSEIKYSSYKNKTVPGSYQLTEQDKKDKKDGKYVFSYGSEKVETYSVQVIAWEYKGLNYSLCAMDSSITKDELADMAAELIDCQDQKERT